MGAVWFCMSFAGIAICLMFCLAAQNDSIRELQDALHCSIEHADELEKTLNRYKICATMDRELYGTDIDAMRKQAKSFEAHIDRLESALIAKNQEIIRLKTRGGER